MKDFEDFGRWLDEEMKHVTEVVEKEIRPTAEKKVISALKKASAKMAEMAKELEERRSRSGA
jgi:Tfp pilus assembly protein PilN